LTELATSRKRFYKQRSVSIKQQERWVAVSFVAPFLLGFLLFNIFPIIYALAISFMDYNQLRQLTTIHFLGIGNYTRMLSDPIVGSAFLKSFYYSLVYVSGIMVFSFLFAELLNKTFYLRAISRTMILVPYVANVVAVAMVWSILLDPFDGPVNSVLRTFGIHNPPLWLGGTNTALATVGLINVWQNLAFQTIVFLAALQGVPKDLYEACEIDGASKWQKIKYVTLPLVSPTTFFLIVTSIIGSFQNYASVRMLTNGGPGISSRVISVNIYEDAFSFNQYSYSSAQAMVLFFLILVITILQWKVQKKWVHY
jgi:multiple sugar transport system permease protein